MVVTSCLLASLTVMDLSKHPLFSPWTDPKSGVTSWLLANRFGPVQQHFYYTNPSVTSDGRWLWLTVAHPPGPSKHLAAVCLDPSNPIIIDLPGAQEDQAHAGLDVDGQAVLFGTGNAIWRATTDGTISEHWRLPAEWLAGRSLHRIATHCSVAADGCILIDGELASHSFIGIADPSNGAWTVIDELQQRHDHGQWCPGNDQRFLVAHDQYVDPNTGQLLHHHARTWIMDRGGRTYQPINPQFTARPYHGACHEWWSSSNSIAYIDYDTGVHECNLDTNTTEHVWAEPLCHAHSDPSRRYYVADQSPYTWAETPCQVLHYDRQTGKRIAIASGLPQPAGGYAHTRGRYHVDPHPQFAGDWIVWTSTVEERITVALTAANDLRS